MFTLTPHLILQKQQTNKLTFRRLASPKEAFSFVKNSKEIKESILIYVVVFFFLNICSFAIEWYGGFLAFAVSSSFTQVQR